MLDASRSGRSEVEKRNQEDVFVRVLPILTEGFTLKHTPDFIVGCYMISIVISKKGNCSDAMLDGLMEAVVSSLSQESLIAGLTSVSILAQRKSEPIIPEKILNALLDMEDFVGVLETVNNAQATDALINAIIYSGISQIIKGSKADNVIDLVDTLLQREILSEDGTSQAMTFIAKGADTICKNESIDSDSRIKFGALVHEIGEHEKLATAFSRAITEASIDVESLELAFSTMIESKPAQAQIEDVEMEDADKAQEEDDRLNKAIESLAQEKTQEVSFMSNSASTLYNKLAVLFELIASDEQKVSKFIQLPVLSKKSAASEPRFLSFFTKFFSGSHSPASRAAAVKIVSSCLSELKNENGPELQALLPYILAALADTTDIVRREVANLLVVFSGMIPKSKRSGSEDVNTKWSNDFLGKPANKLTFLSAHDLQRLVQRCLLPAAEECSLDSRHIARVVEGVIRGKTDQVENAGDLKKTTRQAFLMFLCSHVLASPLYSTKLRLLSITARVNKVGSTTRTQELMPLLRQWKLVKADEVHHIVSTEHVQIKELDTEIVAIVSAKNADAVETLLSLVSTQTETLRPEFVTAVFHRIVESWGALGEKEVQVADHLLQLALGLQKEQAALSQFARDVLSSVSLSGPVLVHLLNTISSSAGDLETNAASTKRRRTSQNNMIATSLKDPSEIHSLLEKLTFILELIDVSSPENHPELLGGLFKALGCLHHLKLQMQSEMSYLLSLILGTLLSIVSKLNETPKVKFDSSIIRADLVIDCVRTSESPQVQNTALLLVAGLSSLAPELILHSVMPIFTFMGSSVLRKDDEYSALVIDQTIDQVVPPLIQSLRSQKKDIVSGTSELLLSFTAAFEHIPSHRRLRLFEALVAKLGPEDFLFAVFSMLANKYPQDRDVLNVMTSLASDFPAELQLSTYSKYIGLTHDALQPKPSLSRTLLGIGSEEGEEPAKVAFNLLVALTHLIKHALAPKMLDVFEATDESAEKANDLYSRILEQTLALTTSTYHIPIVSEAVSGTLNAILGTLTLVDLVDTIEVLLQRKDNDLRRRVLRLLESRLNGKEKDVATHTRVTDFLDTLVEILKSSTEIPLKQASVACMTKIIDNYGKKNPDKVVSSVKVVAGADCLGKTDNQLRVMAVLCLAASVEVLGQAFIPVLPLAMPPCFDLLKATVQKGDKGVELHDAIYTFLSALLVHVPWMISEEYLDSVLLLSFASANAGLPETSDESRLEALRLLAKKVDVEETFRAAQSNWAASVQGGFDSAKELLEVISIAIEKHPKSATVKNVAVLTKLLQNGFDIRRTQHGSEKLSAGEISQLEQGISDIALKMIYKLNDTIFRPLFIQMTEWAATDLPKSDVTGRHLRLTSYLKFVANFFGTLKVNITLYLHSLHHILLTRSQSIVTSYSNYILECVVDVLKNIRCHDQSTRDLWIATMTLLRNSFEHDQDGK